MSRISSSKKIQSSWKISDSSKIYPNEVSMRDSKLLLPEKFSPLKNSSKQSRIFNTSRDKLNLLKNNSSRSPAPAPVSRDANVLFSSHQLTFKDSSQMPESPKKEQPNYPELTSKQSLVLKNLESESPLRVKKRSDFNIQLLKSTQDVNREAINKIKTEFFNFRAQIWNELMEQREMISRMAAELGRQMEMIRVGEDRRVEAVIDCVKSVDVSPKMEEISQQINAFASSIGKYEQVEEVQEMGVDEVLPHVEIMPFQSLEAPIVEVESDKQIRTPISKLQQFSKIPQKRQSPLDKCTQIAQTIGILTQINSSPVRNSKDKSLEKLIIEQYKQKLVSVCRSNEKLLKQPQPSAPSQQHLKLRGNFKLDKFYSAIEKLKSQVNEIRNINEMKQIKKLKIVQVNQ